MVLVSPQWTDFWQILFKWFGAHSSKRALLATSGNKKHPKTFLKFDFIWNVINIRFVFVSYFLTKTTKIASSSRGTLVHLSATPLFQSLSKLHLKFAQLHHGIHHHANTDQIEWPKHHLSSIQLFKMIAHSYSSRCFLQVHISDFLINFSPPYVSRKTSLEIKIKNQTLHMV